MLSLLKNITLPQISLEAGFISTEPARKPDTHNAEEHIIGGYVFDDFADDISEDDITEAFVKQSGVSELESIMAEIAVNQKKLVALLDKCKALAKVEAADEAAKPVEVVTTDEASDLVKVEAADEATKPVEVVTTDETTKPATAEQLEQLIQAKAATQ